MARARASSPRFQKLNRPPQDERGWGWLTADMLDSPAFWALTPAALRIVIRIWLEHIHHAGQENGNLPCTFDDFEAFGVRRGSVADGVAVAVALGWIAIELQGRPGRGASRCPSLYRLTWLPTPDCAPATNNWKRFKDRPSAKLAAALACKKKEASDRRRDRALNGSALPAGPSE